MALLFRHKNTTYFYTWQIFDQILPKVSFGIIHQLMVEFCLVCNSFFLMICSDVKANATCAVKILENCELESPCLKKLLLQVQEVTKEKCGENFFNPPAESDNSNHTSTSQSNEHSYHKDNICTYIICWKNW